MRQLKKYYGEVPTWASPFLYHDRPFDGAERDAVKLDLFFYLPGTEIIIEGTDVLLVREEDGTLGFVDIEKEHIFKLRLPAYATAIKLLEKPPATIGVYRDYVGEAVGFWINPEAPLIVMFDEDKLTVNELLTTTKLLATPTSLQQRKHNAQGWKTLDALRKCNTAKAQGTFETEYLTPPDAPDESSRAAMIFALASCIPPYTRDFGWVELFAAAGLSDAISDMVVAERVTPIHALHAEIELGPRFFPNPTLNVTEREVECLISLYEIEAEALMESRTASYHVEKWLNERNRRAADYTMMLTTSDSSRYSHCMFQPAF